MKTFDGIDYEFRPESYWEDSTVQQAILREVKGTNRRELITKALAEVFPSGTLHPAKAWIAVVQ